MKLMGKYLVLFSAPLSYNKCYSHAGWSFRDIQLIFCTEIVQYSGIIYQQELQRQMCRKFRGKVREMYKSKSEGDAHELG